MAVALIKRLRGAISGFRMQASEALSDLRHPTAWLKNWALGPIASAGVYVSPQSAMMLAPYFAAARAISEDVAKLPLKVYQRQDRGKRVAPEHWAYPLLHDAPNQYQGSMNFREAMTFAVLTWGNAYAPIFFDQRGLPDSFGLPLHPGYVEPRIDTNQQLYYRVHLDDNRTHRDGAGQLQSWVDLPQEEMLHLRGPSSDGITGWSIARLGAESLGVALAAQSFAGRFFANGMNVGAVLEHPQTLSETALEHLRESFEEQYGGVENANKPLILEEGMKFQRLSIPPEDAQFLESRKFQVDEIARWFRIPPHKIASMENATFSNIEHQSLEYIGDSLQPWMTRWEQELQRKFFTPYDPDYFCEHVVLGLLRGDQSARASYYNTRFNLGSLSPNDIRELENENPIDDPNADQYFVQLNLTRLSDVGEEEQPPNQGLPFGDEEENDDDDPFIE